ncbi:3-oxoacyl-[acyl-carrier-protein] synthase III C-terminal domain-containing protein [Flavobacterium sp.]|uniref:3-oxoacyl-[acyl-carrier-protein] synthase III C-terminal domain-containing protein n=1 Tax=Flavobacterium sp. TaxID=239 RepID=UPI0025CC8C34|nr:3-oxoacyl-[acyl-carrier-protein] synthase III C-terminal domain-containing protein [Flavobacterium sp.]
MSFASFHNIRISGIATAVPTQKHAVEGQTASDLGFAAAEKLLEEKITDRTELGFIVFLTKTPDYRSTASPIVLQHRLQLPIDCLAYDVNLGALGFLAGIQLGCSLINGLNTRKGLIVIGDTNSKQLEDQHPLLAHFGDGATAILLEQAASSSINLATFSQGEGYQSYLLPGGGFRTNERRKAYNLSGLPTATEDHRLRYDQEQLFRFFSTTIPADLKAFLAKIKGSTTSFDKVALHYAPEDFISAIVSETGFDEAAICVGSDAYTEVSGATIPLLLTAADEGKRVLGIAYGEGFSWGFIDFCLHENTVLPLIKTDVYFTEGFVTHEI